MIRLTIRSIGNRKKSFIMTTCLCILAFMMLSVSVYIYENSVYSRKTIENAVKSGTHHSGIIAVMNDYEDDTFVRFRQDLYNTPVISKIGLIDTAKGFDTTTLSHIQSELEHRENDGIDYIWVDSSAADFYNLSLSEGTFDADMPIDDTTYYAYLGSAYQKDYKLGDTFTDTLSNGMQFTFIVKGFLKDHNRIIDIETFLSADAFVNDKCYTTLSDTGVILLSNRDSVFNVMLYSWEEDCSADEAEKEVKKIAEKYDFSVITGRIDDILDAKEESSQEINAFILNILGIILITTVLMLICIQISAVFTNLSEYGIMYANGFGTGNLAFMLFIELLFKMLLVCICSLVGVRFVLTKVFYDVEGQVEVYNEIFYRYVIPGNLLAGIIILIVAFVVPLIVLMHQKPITLIGGNDT